MPSQNWRGGLQIGERGVGKFIEAGMTEEGFDAQHAGLQERLNVSCIAGNHAAVEADVDPTFADRRLAFGFQRGHRRRDRAAVERHIDNGRHSASRRCFGCRFEAFPLGAAGFIHMHMRIDHAGGDDQIAEILDRQIGRRLRRACAIFHNVDDPLAIDHHNRRSHAVAENYTAARQGESRRRGSVAGRAYDYSSDRSR